MAFNFQGDSLSPWGSLNGASWRCAYIKTSTAVSQHVQSDPPECTLTGCLDTAQPGSRYTIDSSGSADDVSCLSLLDTPCQDRATADQACSASRTTTPGSSIRHPAPAPKTSPVTPSSGSSLNANLPPDLPKEIIIPRSLFAPPLAAIARIHAPPLWGAQCKGGAKCATAGAEAPEESQLPSMPEQVLRVGNLNRRKRRRRSLVDLEQMFESGERVGSLLQSKVALEHEVVELFDRHDVLSAHLPRHMQHEEESFKASIAACMPPAAAGPAMGTRPVPTPCLDPLLSMMPEPFVSADDLHAASNLLGDAMGEMECKGPSNVQRGIADAEEEDLKRPNLLSFLEISSTQRERLAAAYSRHLEDAEALHSLAIARKLQEQAPILPSLGTHADRAELSVLSDKSEDMMRDLEDKCYQVLNETQMAKVSALAAVKTLHRSVTVPHKPPAGAACVEMAVAKAGLAPRKVSQDNTSASHDIGYDVDEPLEDSNVASKDPINGTLDGLATAAAKELPARTAQRNGSGRGADTVQNCSGVTGHLLELGPKTGDTAVVTAACVSQSKRFIMMTNSPSQ